MYLIPAIDLKDGHCVRLKQGDMEQSTTFGEDPAQMALNWVAKGARRLHLVDLNGAFAGTPQNKAAIKAILKAVGHDIPVQLGGGIRDLDTIEKYIDAGLRYVIIGTAAVKNPGFLRDACSAFGHPVERHLRGVFTKGCGLLHVTLLEAHAVSVFEVNGGNEIHDESEVQGFQCRKLRYRAKPCAALFSG